MTQDTTEDRVVRLEASHYRTGEDLVSIKGELRTLRETVDRNHAATLEEFGSVHANITDLRTEVLGHREEADARHTTLVEMLQTVLDRLPPK